jgi:hypothetical protein
MELSISPYDDRMKNQVAELFHSQYGTPPLVFQKLMDDFYQHPYQAKRCIRVVALSGDKVVGFQSFFYWPYFFNEKKYNSYQSGNSLVHPGFRGKGIFQMLLQYVESKRTELGIDFLMGFPVEMSKKSFLKDKWENIFDLKWMIKTVNPFSFLFRSEHERLRSCFDTLSRLQQGIIPGQFRLSAEPDFMEWRNSYSTAPYYYFSYIEKDKHVEFTLKYNKRKSYVKELVIGDIRFTHSDPVLLGNALKALVKKTNRSRCITLLSFAFNTRSVIPLKQVLERCRFRELSNKIYFIIKPTFPIEGLTSPGNWCVFRSDVDTW